MTPRQEHLNDRDNSKPHALGSNAVIRHNATEVMAAEKRFAIAERWVSHAYTIQPPDTHLIAMRIRQAEMAAVQYRRALITLIGKP